MNQHEPRSYELSWVDYTTAKNKGQSSWARVDQDDKGKLWTHVYNCLWRHKGVGAETSQSGLMQAAFVLKGKVGGEAGAEVTKTGQKILKHVEDKNARGKLPRSDTDIDVFNTPHKVVRAGLHWLGSMLAESLQACNSCRRRTRSKTHCI
jgi:hypothetical protein